MKIRKANIRDLLIIYLWKNDQLAREMSRNNKKVQLLEHIMWFLKILKSKNNFLYIFCINNEKIGNVRFDRIEPYIKKNAYFVSINVNPKFRGKQLSKTMLSNSIQEFSKETKLHSYLLVAEIKKINQASQKIFRSLGFKVDTSDATFDVLHYYYDSINN